VVRRSPAEVALRQGDQWWPLGWSHSRPTGRQPADGTGQDFLFGRFAAVGVACCNRIANGVSVLSAGDDATRVVSFAALAPSTRRDHVAGLHSSPHQRTEIMLHACTVRPIDAQGSSCGPALLAEQFGDGTEAILDCAESLDQYRVQVVAAAAIDGRTAFRVGQGRLVEAPRSRGIV